MQLAHQHILCVFSLVGALDPSGLHQTGMPHEFFLMFSAVNENLSWYLEENIKEFCPNTTTPRNDTEFQDSNLLHCM